MPDLAEHFVSDSRSFLTEFYMPRVERCVARLTNEQLWSRSNEASNSIGNLLLHMTGSTRYWAAEAIGGTPIVRVRQQEFDRRDPISSHALLAGLREAVSDADRRLAELAGEKLLETRNVNGRQLTVLWCVYHIIEHFAMHTGQILSMTKALVGEPLPADNAPTTGASKSNR